MKFRARVEPPQPMRGLEVPQKVVEALGGGIGVVTGDEIEVEVEFDPEPRVVIEPADLARALDADPLARAAHNHLSYGLKLQHVRAIESAKKPRVPE